MGEFSLTHWLIILAILLIFFGPSKLPQLGQSLGKAIRGFKEGIKEVQDEGKSSDQGSTGSQISDHSDGSAQIHSTEDTKSKNKV